MTRWRSLSIGTLELPTQLQMTDRSHDQRQAERIAQLGELSMRSQRDADMHTISLTGEIHLANAPAVEEELLRVEDTDARTIVLDLSAVTFIDSTGIKLLFSAQLRDGADRLILQRPPDRVMRVLRIVGIDHLLPFAD